MSNEATGFLLRAAKEAKYTTYENLSGEVKFGDSDDVIGGDTNVYLSSGSVYCFLAIAIEGSSTEQLFSEVGRAAQPIDSDGMIYPIYFGKDINPGSRIADHVRPRSVTVNAGLEGIKSLRKFRLIYGSIYVARYSEFESFLHEMYAPLIGTSRAGRQSTYTVIVN